MTNILFTGATSTELNAIKEKVKEQKIPNIKPAFLNTGIGIYNTIYELTRFIDNNNVDFIINIGICGFINATDNLLQIARIINAHNEKELIPPILFKYARLGEITCSELPAYNYYIPTNLVDMESFGIEFVGDKFKIPRIILKLPYDCILEEKVTVENLDKDRVKEKIQQHLHYQDLLEKIKEYMQG